ncbi:hypothetical protein SAMN05216466_10575 [Paraburkholderia phenazinium]|jgi:hypothetical protein|uniref:Uncharacterized protein n=1 Tax=Paraburkholderia phenazinium TaxID=60549 RepID=A0A1G7WXY4_9BURK|nr:hypothetical protein SAMN05216466_10575 [Paraburkholderia phenazinium]
MHASRASLKVATGVIIAMAHFVRARSLLPLAPGWRAVHLWQPASRSTPHPNAHDETNEAHHVAQPC